MLDPDEHMRRYGVERTERSSALPDPQCDVPQLRAEPLDGAADLDEARFQRPMVVQFPKRNEPFTGSVVSFSMSVIT